jgi:hypothetical protein
MPKPCSFAQYKYQDLQDDTQVPSRSRALVLNACTKDSIFI